MTTIKISDLAIGDWVQANGAAKRVHSIEYQNGEYFVHFSDPDTNSEDYMHAPFIDPIPITPEILEANGFVKNGEYNEWNIGTWRTPSLLGVSLERPAITIKWNGSSIFIDQAKYVHQLQHALRLAGVEKEIVMPKK